MTLLARDGNSFSAILKSPLFRALALATGYSAWIIGVRLVVLTLITYFLISSPSPGASPTRLQEISEVFSANELTLIGFASLAFVLILRSLHPITSTTLADFFSPARFEKLFAPGFLQGTVVATGLVSAFLVSGVYRYLGFTLQFDDASLALAGILIRVAALGLMAYCEEFLFRQRIFAHLKGRFPVWAAAVLVAFVYCGVKALQFDLSIMHLMTLFLLSLSLSARQHEDGDFMRGAGFIAGLLIVLHPLFSLPVFGNDFPGLLLIKFQPLVSSQPGGDTATRLFTGGIGGPLSGFGLQIILGLDLARAIWLRKKTSFPLKQRWLKSRHRGSK